VWRTANVVILMAAASIGLLFRPALAQTKVSDLLRQLESRKTTDSAKAQLLQLGRSDSKARRYLATHLPSLIAADPWNPNRERGSLDPLRRQWENAVYLAGGLELAEAAPALAKRIDVRSSPLFDNSNAAGYALCQIGDPAIPSLQRVLANGNQDQRTLAVRALEDIDSPKSIAVLRDYANNVKDSYLTDRLRTYFLNGPRVEPARACRSAGIPKETPGTQSGAGGRPGNGP